MVTVRRAFSSIVGFAGVALIAGFTPAQARDSDVAAAQGDRLVGADGQAVKIGGGVRTYEVPFSLARVPSKPQLQFDFHVVTTGWCPTTYVPTTISVNERVIKKIDFRDFDVGDRKNFALAIPSAALKVGRNVLRVETGACQYEYDRIKLNNVTLMR